MASTTELDALRKINHGLGQCIEMIRTTSNTCVSTNEGVVVALDLVDQWYRILRLAARVGLDDEDDGEFEDEDELERLVAEAEAKQRVLEFDLRRAKRE